MREKHELRADIETAAEASALLSNPLLIASLKTMEDLTSEDFRSLGFDDITRMQECNVKLKLIDEFKSNLITLINSGGSALDSLEIIKQHEREVTK